MKNHLKRPQKSQKNHPKHPPKIPKKLQKKNPDPKNLVKNPDFVSIQDCNKNKKRKKRVKKYIEDVFPNFWPLDAKILIC